MAEANPVSTGLRPVTGLAMTQRSESPYAQTAGVESRLCWFLLDIGVGNKEERLLYT